MTDFQTGFAIGVSAGGAFFGLLFMLLAFLRGAHGLRGLDREDEQSYVSEGVRRFERQLQRYGGPWR